jgi:hypothetical protein
MMLKKPIIKFWEDITIGYKNIIRNNPDLKDFVSDNYDNLLEEINSSVNPALLRDSSSEETFSIETDKIFKSGLKNLFSSKTYFIEGSSKDNIITDDRNKSPELKIYFFTILISPFKFLIEWFNFRFWSRNITTRFLIRIYNIIDFNKNFFTNLFSCRTEKSKSIPSL